MPGYGDPEYWEKRYSDYKGTTFDWLENYSTLKSIIGSLVSKNVRVLILGCGNAELSEEMYNDGYDYIYNIDISTVVIEQMRQRNIDKRPMSWTVMDVRDLKFESDYFHIAIDKSTIDALLCGNHAYLNVAKMTREVQRVLQVGGYYVVISYGAPDTRLEHLEWDHLSFDVSHMTIGEESGNQHFVYICKKREDADQKSIDNWAIVERILMEADKEDPEEEEQVDSGENEEENDY